MILVTKYSSCKDYTHGGEAGLTYEFVGANATALTNPDFSDLDYWKPVTEHPLFL